MGSGAGAWRVEHDSVVAAKLFRTERRAKQIAPESLDRLQARHLARGLGQRGKRRCVVLEGIDRCLCGKRKGEGAETGEEIGDLLRLADKLADQIDQDSFRGGRCLEKGAGRQVHGRAGELDHGCRELDHQLAIHCAARDA